MTITAYQTSAVASRWATSSCGMGSGVMASFLRAGAAASGSQISRTSLIYPGAGSERAGAGGKGRRGRGRCQRRRSSSLSEKPQMSSSSLLESSFSKRSSTPFSRSSAVNIDQVFVLRRANYRRKSSPHRNEHYDVFFSIRSLSLYHLNSSLRTYAQRMISDCFFSKSRAQFPLLTSCTPYLPTLLELETLICHFFHLKLKPHGLDSRRAWHDKFAVTNDQISTR